MDKLIEEIKAALIKYGHNDLCEGADVRDTLLDLLLLAQDVDQATPNISSELPVARILERV